MYTKRQLVNAAFEEIALASYVFDSTPEEMQAAVRRLDAMMATFGGALGIRLGYNSTVDPLDADPDQASGLPDWANEAVFLQLAIRLSASYGKALAKSTLSTAKLAYDMVMARLMSSQIPEIQPMGNLPIGAGFKRRYAPNPFAGPTPDRLTTGPDGLLDFNGTVPIP
jgi:hypothetical protein